MSHAYPPIIPQPLQGPTVAPGVVLWYKIYCGAMMVLYLFLAAIGLVLILMRDTIASSGSQSQSQDPAELLVIGAVYIVMGAVFGVVYLVGLLWNRGKGAWVYGIVTIALGLTSLCCLPATIPLLIFWLKPECKAWLMRPV